MPVNIYNVDINIKIYYVCPMPPTLLLTAYYHDTFGAESSDSCKVCLGFLSNLI